MAWVTPTSVSTGDVLQASEWNQSVVANAAELAPFFSAWTSFTPAWTGITVGNGTNTGAYLKVGKFVAFRTAFTFGSTSAITSGISLTLPVTAVAAFSGSFTVFFQDTGTGYNQGFVRQSSTTSMNVYVAQANQTYVVAADASSTIPFTWVATDVLAVSGFYEAA